MPDTIITDGGGNGGAGVIAGVILAVVLVVGGIWLFNNGFFNGVAPSGSSVTVQTPAVTVETPAAK